MRFGLSGVQLKIEGTKRGSLNNDSRRKSQMIPSEFMGAEMEIKFRFFLLIGDYLARFCAEYLVDLVPPHDEGWLCPVCDCKVDCVDLLNDSMGTDLSINDTWEKVFPETAVYGDKFNDISRLPDDSEDENDNPDAPQVSEDEVDVEDPSSNESDESDFSSAS
ncbi:unnamed protein product [Lactuca saligna]|uniref:Uncharacterized protein n=1 Tax=Lactuca saligna TaxID=75948 RepID=A0AA35ZHW6_LACSI|nr:unnamed protein product [Lactuca saligna]